MRLINKFVRQWSEDSGLLYFLITLSLLIFVFYPLADNSFFGRIAINSIATILVFFGTISVGVFEFKKWSLFVLALIVGASNIVVIFFDTGDYFIIHLLIRIIFLYCIAYLILKKILTTDKITKYSIAGAVTVYLLIGLIWALTFFTLYKLSPDTFTLSKNLSVNDDITWDFIYFSYTTLTTLGYGDVLPNAPFTMSLAALEGLIGQLYPVVLIGRLVSVFSRVKD